MGFASDDKTVSEFIDFGIEQVCRYHKTPNFLLGPIGGLSFEVSAGQENRSNSIRILLGG